VSSGVDPDPASGQHQQSLLRIQTKRWRIQLIGEGLQSPSAGGTLRLHVRERRQIDENHIASH